MFQLVSLHVSGLAYGKPYSWCDTVGQKVRIYHVYFINEIISTKMSHSLFCLF